MSDELPLSKAAAKGSRRMLFRPLDAGRLQLRNRLMAPPHASVINDLFGSEDEGVASLAYWQAWAESGIGWIDGITGIIDSLVPVGFDPSGVGARVQGVFRRPVFHERASCDAELLHSHDVFATGQLVHQGGMPHGASAIQSSLINHQMPHVLTLDEIEWFVREFTFSALEYDRAGLDGVELHANNDDILQWFISPRTNHRTDQYGGSLENRVRFVIEIIESIRAIARPSFAIGVRVTMDERVEGGYDIDDAVAICKVLEAHGIDYVHGVVGSPWGNPGYIPPGSWPVAAFVPLAGRIRNEVSIPVVYTGRLNTPDVAEAVLQAGHADVVGVARAVMSDADFVRKAREGRDEDIRRCIGCNECIHRVLIDGIVSACSVNPEAGREHVLARDVGRGAADTRKRRLLVVGGGPAGLALAVRASERGLQVSLWERVTELGGQIRVASRGPGLGDLMFYVDHQSRRLEQLGVDVRLGCDADAGQVCAFAADVVAVATGARSRRPAIDGFDRLDVHDVRDVLMGEDVPGDRVVVVSQDDHMAPMAVAEHLAAAGKRVHVVCQTNGPSPMLGRHTLGTVLAKLSHLGVTWTFMERVVGTDGKGVHTKNVYSNQPGPPIPCDSVVLACGAESDTALADALRGRVDRLHVIGDAFAPRRISFATKQGYLLAELLADESTSPRVEAGGARTHR